MHPKHQQLLQTLERIDNGNRNARAERIEWLALHEPPSVGAMVGRSETLQLLSEARAVFIDGHFVATLLIAMSFIEHTIVEELQLLGHIEGSPKFSSVLNTAKEHKVFPQDWIERTKTLSFRRNSFAHLKEPSNSHGLGERIMIEQRHPKLILESDAKDAIDLLFNFFVATLREIDGKDIPRLMNSRST